MAWPPQVSDFKTRFDRDFVYGDGLDSVRTLDVQNALNDATSMFNQSLWSSPTEQATAYLLLSAHLLVLNMQMAGGPSARKLGRGLDNVGGGVINTKAVGGISVGYAIPERVANSPILSPLMRTDYGQRYLSMLVPRLVGNVTVAGGPVDSDVSVNDPSQT